MQWNIAMAMDEYFFQTKRVGFRLFRDNDLMPFAELNADPEVMQFFPSTLSSIESESLMQRINRKIEENGFGFWAAELLATNELIGFVGLNQVSFTAEFTPAVEIGWRLARRFWGSGLATESAEECLNFGFSSLKLSSVCSFTSLLNDRSYRVMQRIGMTKIGEFDHPKINPDHRLCRHLLCEITAEQFFQRSAQSEIS